MPIHSPNLLASGFGDPLANGIYDLQYEDCPNSNVLYTNVNGYQIIYGKNGLLRWTLTSGYPYNYLNYDACNSNPTGAWSSVYGPSPAGTVAAIEVSSSSSSSSSSISSSTSSAVLPIYGLTYYSDFKDINAINNPVMGSNAQMQFYGFFDKAWTANTLQFDNFGYGLKKTLNNQGSIYCHDSSQLFSMSKGCVGIVLSLPQDIVDGVYAPLKNSTLDANEYVLWGVNIGKYDCGQPGFYAALTPRGIEFTIVGSETQWTITDTTTNITKNTDVYLQFAWGHDYTDFTLDSDLSIMGMFVNGVNTVLSNPPIDYDDITNLPFYALNNPFFVSNLECNIKKLVVYNEVPSGLLAELNTSSSSSSSGFSSSSSSSSYSSSTSFEYSSSSVSTSSSSSSMVPCHGCIPPLKDTYTFTITSSIPLSSLVGIPYKMYHTGGCTWQASYPVTIPPYSPGTLSLSLVWTGYIWGVLVTLSSLPWLHCSGNGPASDCQPVGIYTNSYGCGAFTVS